MGAWWRPPDPENETAAQRGPGGGRSCGDSVNRVLEEPQRICTLTPRTPSIYRLRPETACAVKVAILRSGGWVKP
jgi:hypothetical protein